MTLMPHNFDAISFLFGNAVSLQEMCHCKALKPFDDNVVSFLDHFSKRLFRHPLAKAYPDVASLAFWCRKASILQMRQHYPNLAQRVGRGLIFHIAPSNVAVNFAYSLVVGLLSGNSNIVRVPSRDFPQVEIICEVLTASLAEWDNVAPYLCLVRYGHEKNINDLFSSWCQTRIIWGGDETIATLRQSPLPARGLDLSFASRYSLVLIDAGSYLAMSDKALIAERFYNDTFLTDQNACTSPGLVVWLGDAPQIEQARTRFWTEFEQFSQRKYELQPVMAVRKLLEFCKLCATKEGIYKASGDQNLVYRVLVDSLNNDTMAYACSGGYFLEYLAGDISDIYPVCNSQCQTLALLGVEQGVVTRFLDDYQPAGIDRVVPVGRTLDFGLQWDGYDLIYSLTRTIVLF